MLLGDPRSTLLKLDWSFFQFASFSIFTIGAGYFRDPIDLTQKKIGEYYRSPSLFDFFFILGLCKEDRSIYCSDNLFMLDNHIIFFLFLFLFVIFLLPNLKSFSFFRDIQFFFFFFKFIWLPSSS